MYMTQVLSLSQMKESVVVGGGVSILFRYVIVVAVKMVSVEFSEPFTALLLN